MRARSGNLQMRVAIYVDGAYNQGLHWILNECAFYRHNLQAPTEQAGDSGTNIFPKTQIA